MEKEINNLIDQCDKIIAILKALNKELDKLNNLVK